MDESAYCAAAWAAGIKQKALAAHFGYKSPVPVCIAIREFLNAWADPAKLVPAPRFRSGPLSGNALLDSVIYGPARKALVPTALARFQCARDRLIVATGPGAARSFENA